ncbi:MAG: GIY-YIG nuclease family protein [Alphaproteobacteria bacterium]|nr:GIY-YIG nuclease family protein [Alphaproteobacteria bacterium]
MFFLYVVAHKNEDGDFVKPIKIGVTNNLDRRLREIQTGNPLKVGVYASIPFSFEKVAYEAEQHFHDIYKVTSSLQGEWFDIDPWDAFCGPFSRLTASDVRIARLNEYINTLKWKISELEMVLGEQESLIEDVFRSELNDQNDRIFDKYSRAMCKKYKEVLSTIERLKSGAEKGVVFCPTPYWKNLAKRK